MSPRDKIGMDPAEIRRRNFIQPGAFPLTTNTGAAYDSGEYEKALDAVLKASGYKELREEQARRRAANDPVALGIGLSAYVEVTAPVGLHIEFGAVEVHDDGSASVFAGTSVHGQGHHTAFAMLATDVLGIPMDKIKLVNSDTDRVAAWNRHARFPVAANRGLAPSTWRPRRCSLGPRRSLPICSRRAAEDIVAEGGVLHVAGLRRSRSPGRNWRSPRRTRTSCPPGSTRTSLRHELDFDGTNSTFPFGAHVSVVEVDTETGKVTLRRHVAVDDCGRILNPLLVSRTAARRHRPGRGAGDLRVGAATTKTATPSPRRSSTTPSRRPPSCRASRRRTRKPTARGTRWEPRASASRARSARPRRSRTRSSTPSRTSESRTSTCRALPNGCGPHSTQSELASKVRSLRLHPVGGGHRVT